ncbi:hypothetical protein COB57_02615 [Candidatus Peregrinibacteria bacterium]|nr:MAG: hypothetical protein COB57_02615 [Candidatus Peregrinibacteria bacterium]
MKKLLAAFLCIIPLFTVSAASVEESCFIDLQENVKKIGLFGNENKDLFDMSYSDIEKKFSKNYKNMSSFGIDLDDNLFEMRLYSFGDQTGYIHPPYSPYPVSKKTDTWSKATKEFIIAEEYVRLPDNTKQLISCSFMQMNAGDLMKVTAENYLYDGEMISVIQGDDMRQGYKAWYNENTTYAHDNSALVSWQRMFIYPKDSQNEYFNRYDVLSSFPGKRVENFSDFAPVPLDKEVFLATLSQEAQDTIKEKYPEGIPDNIVPDGGGIRVYQADENGQIINGLAPDSLMPIEPEDLDNIFAFQSYYQAIQDTFPEFSEHLALRGVLHFDTMKELLATRDNEYFNYLWHTVLDTREITKYALLKKQGKIQEKDVFYEDSLSAIESIEEEAKILLLEHKDLVKDAQGKMIEEKPVKKIGSFVGEKPDSPMATASQMPSQMEIVFFFLGLTGIFGGVIWLLVRLIKNKK